MDKYIRVKNCNCISDATIEIVEKSLNIKYGSNGTGKSTISEAIYAQANNETDRLKDFKPYGSNDNSQPTVDNPYFHVVKVFNEDYVNSYLFQGDEFLDDSFQVFLKSDKCDSLAAQIERMLEELQDLINNIDAIHNLRTFLPQYTAAVKASDGTVSRRGGVAEFVNGNGGGFNHYSELKAYKPFYKGILTKCLGSAGIKDIDLIEITYDENFKCFEYNKYLQADLFPVKRGCCFAINDNTAYLFTHGIAPSVISNRRYFQGGTNVPAPLKIVKHYGNGDLAQIASEILGLSKMNWNSFGLYSKLPCTIQSSNAIAKVGWLLPQYEGMIYEYRNFM